MTRRRMTKTLIAKAHVASTTLTAVKAQHPQYHVNVVTLLAQEWQLRGSAVAC